MARRRKGHVHPYEEPNLLPLMNIMFVLMLSVLTMSSFVPLGIITSEAPKVVGGPPSGAATAEKKTKPMNLTVFATKDGFDIQMFDQRVLGAGNGVLLPKIASTEGPVYDFAGLHGFMVRIKKAHPDERNIFIGQGPDVPYETLIAIMDEVREMKPEDEFPPEIMAQKVMFDHPSLIAGVLQ